MASVCGLLIHLKLSFEDEFKVYDLGSGVNSGRNNHHEFVL